MYVRPNSRIRGLASGYAVPRQRGFGQLTTVATAIETQEGYYPGSLAYVNNNPGNLMAAGQPGCTVTSTGLCSFASFADGWNALLNQISLDASRGLTISQFTAKYAPAAAGNDPTTYADNIASAVGLSPSDPLSTAITQDGSPSMVSDVADVGSSIQSYLTQGLQDLTGGSDDTSSGVDLSSIGLGVVDPTVLVLGGVGLLLALWVVMRR